MFFNIHHCEIIATNSNAISYHIHHERSDPPVYDAVNRIITLSSHTENPEKVLLECIHDNHTSPYFIDSVELHLVIDNSELSIRPLDYPSLYFDDSDRAIEVIGNRFIYRVDIDYALDHIDDLKKLSIYANSENTFQFYFHEDNGITLIGPSFYKSS